MSDEGHISNEKLQKFGAGDAARTYAASGAQENRSRYRNYPDLLNEWQARLELPEDESFFSYSRLDGILSEKQWNDLRTGKALPGDRLGDYLCQAIRKVVDIGDRYYKYLAGADPDAPRIEIGKVEYALLKTTLQEMFHQAAQQQPEGDRRWPYPYAKRTLAETVDSEFFKTLKHRLREKYDPAGTKGDQELLTLLGGVIETGANQNFHGRVKITPLMLMGFVRIPETLSIENFCEQLDGFVGSNDTSSRDDSFRKQMCAFYEAVPGIDLVTPHQANLGENWEYFHCARINERRGIMPLSQSPKTVSYEEIRLLETRERNGVKYRHRSTMAGVLAAYPSLEKPNQEVIRARLGRVPDKTTLRGYLEYLIEQRGVNNQTVSRVVTEYFKGETALTPPGNISRLLLGYKNRKINKQHLDQIVFALMLDDAEITKANRSLKQDVRRPKGRRITEQELETLYSLFLEEKAAAAEEYSELGQIFQAVFDQVNYRIPPALNTKFWTIYLPAHTEMSQSQAQKLLASAAEFCRQPKLQSERDFLLEETIGHIWKKDMSAGSDPMAYLLQLFSAKGTNGNVERFAKKRRQDLAEYAKPIVEAGLSRQYKIALQDDKAALNKMPAEKVLEDALTVFDDFPHKTQAMVESSVSHALNYLWAREGLAPTPDNPRTRERLDFVLDLTESDRTLKTQQKVIIKKMADNLIRADKGFIHTFGAALQDRERKR